MSRTVYHLTYLRALQMAVRNTCALSRAELEDLIENNTPYLGDDENGDYVVMGDKNEK